jgi:DNA polymerase III subunit gamma/tau
MAWYRIYRPQQVSELALTPIREYLEGILKSGRYAHAYLFAGPKGTGKTSTARILARILNEPKNAKLVLAKKGPLLEPSAENDLLSKISQGQSQVVLEQDAASHRGIDDIRALQEQISVIPSEGLIRIVILDEVHMLTTEAFNALLKMLEEPPERVVFILATTELHKIPATVQSRCEILRFRQASPEEIGVVLGVIAKKEKITLSADVLGQLVRASQGSFRDAVKYFEAIVQGKDVDVKHLAAVLGNTEQSLELLKILAKKDLLAVSAFFQDYRQQGLDFSILEQAIFLQLQERLHRAIERDESRTTVAHIAQLLEHLVSRVGGYEPVDGLKLELACVAWCLGEERNHPEQPPSSKQESDSKPQRKSEPIAPKKPAVAARVEEVVKTVLADSDKPIDDPVALNTEQLDRETLLKQWGNLMLATRTKSQAVESLLRNAQLGKVEGTRLEIQFEMVFHKEKLESPKYSQVFLEVLREKVHPQANFLCRVNEPVTQISVQTEQSNSEDQLLQAVEAAVFSLEEKAHLAPLPAVVSSQE